MLGFLFKGDDCCRFAAWLLLAQTGLNRNRTHARATNNSTQLYVDDATDTFTRCTAGA